MKFLVIFIVISIILVLYNGKKTKYLVEYESNGPSFFGDGDYEYHYNLKILIETKSIFGTRRKFIYTKYIATMFQNLNSLYNHWDGLIKNKTPLK